MSAFFRYPHTPHLAWLGAGRPRDDKVLAPDEVDEILARDLVVEEKVDGANVGISVGERGEVRVQNRGSYLGRDACHPQFKPLFRWLDARAEALAAALAPGLVLFGEWCFAVHSVRYTRLPDWFLAFDVCEADRGRFWSTARRDAFASGLGIRVVPHVARGRFDVARLVDLLGASQLTDGPAEGIVVRADDGDWLGARAKLVRAEFLQDIEEHWSRRPLRPNALA